jgi:hypothetical protein
MITIIYTRNNIVEGTLTLDRAPRVITSDIDSLWVTNPSRNSVTRIISSKDSPIFSIPSGSADLMVNTAYNLQTYIAVTGGAALTFTMTPNSYAVLNGSILTCNGTTGINCINIIADSSETISQSAGSSPFTFSVFDITVFDVSGTSVPNNGSTALSISISDGETIDLNTFVSVIGLDYEDVLSYLRLSGNASLSGSILSVPTSASIVLQVNCPQFDSPVIAAGQITLTLNVTVIQPPVPPPTPTPSPTIGAIRSTNAQPSGGVVAAINAGIAVVQATQSKPPRFTGKNGAGSGGYMTLLKGRNAIKIKNSI